MSLNFLILILSSSSLSTAPLPPAGDSFSEVGCAGAPFICRQFAGPATVQGSQRGLLSVTPDSSVKDLQSRAESDARAQRWLSY